MKDIYKYIKLPQEERQAHLKLDDPCIERGGQSMYLKGLVAHLRDTTIPDGKKIHVCHACHNAKCSNPDHLYWGTASENAIDRDNFYGLTIWDRMVEKHGLEEAKRIQRGNADQSKAGRGNKGKPKSEEHKRKLSEAMKGKAKKGNPSSGRPPAMKKSDLVDLVDRLGFRGAAKELGISWTAVRGRYYYKTKKNTDNG